MAYTKIFSKRNISLLAFIFVSLMVGIVARSSRINFEGKRYEGFEEEDEEEEEGENNQAGFGVMRST